MSECKHNSIDPYGCYCDDCGQTCCDIIESQQARLDATELLVIKLAGILEDAYQEGWQAGKTTCSADGNYIHDWNDSDTKKTVDMPSE